MASSSFRPLNLLYTLLSDTTSGFKIFTEERSDLANHLPFLLIYSEAPERIGNYSLKGRGAKVQISLTSYAEDDDLAFSICDSAYSALEDNLNKVTEFGWINYIEEKNAPYNVPGVSQTADNVFTYTCDLVLTIRKD